MEIPVKYKQDSDYLHLQKILSPLTFGDEYTGDSLKQAAQKVVESHLNAYKEIEPEFEKELAKSGEAYSFEWDLGYFDTEDIMATENFYLTDTGICWVYNPYEIACYATGQTSIEIPFKEIDSYILPDSPVRRLIK